MFLTQKIILSVGVLLISIIFQPNALTAQGPIIEDKHSSLYKYENDKYTYEELKDIFRESPEAFSHYKKYHSRQNWARGAAYITVASLTTGVILDSIDNENNLGESENMGSTGRIFKYASVVTGVVGITCYVGSRISKGKAIDTYNDHVKSNWIQEVSIGKVDNGLGLRISF